MKVKLVEIKPEASDVRSFIWQPERPISWQAGQYLHYRLPHPDADDRGVERWFTISAAPFEGNLMLTTRFTADHGSTFKQALAKLRVGDEVEVESPRGDFIAEDPNQHYVFIAGGIGITPFRSILLQLDHEGQAINIDLMYTNRNEEYVFMDEFQKIAQGQPNFRIYKFTGDARITQADINQVVTDLNQAVFYVSGPKPMVEGYTEMLGQMDIPPINIKTDYFPGYGAN